MPNEIFHLAFVLFINLDNDIILNDELLGQPLIITFMCTLVDKLDSVSLSLLSERC